MCSRRGIGNIWLGQARQCKLEMVCVRIRLFRIQDCMEEKMGRIGGVQALSVPSIDGKRAANGSTRCTVQFVAAI